MILLLVEGVLLQEQPEAMMIRLLLFLLLFCGPALARDDGRYANSPLKEWFNRLARWRDTMAHMQISTEMSIHLCGDACEP